MNVRITDDHPASGVDPVALHLWATVTLAAEGYPETTEVSLTLVTDDQMAVWNATALGHEGPTDVLSFPVELLQPGVVPVDDEDGPPLLVGDVVIAPDYVRRQAMDMAVDPLDELALMVTHGILHLLGYDHTKDREAELMESRERDILELVGRRRR
jgi:probable rRNA maturation factor